MPRAQMSQVQCTLNRPSALQVWYVINFIFIKLDQGISLKGEVSKNFPKMINNLSIVIV